MERWQREYILKNLPALITDTRCSVSLLAGLESSKILSKVESERLGSAQLANQEKSRLLYDILMGRSKAYEVITKLLFENNQSGAFLILLKGFQTVNILNPFVVCGIRLDVDRFRDLTVKFQGKICILSNICKEVETDTLHQILQSNITAHDYVNIYLKSTKEHNFVLAKNTIPDTKSYYISRTMSVRNLVDPKIFAQPNCNDIFILQGIERCHLTFLAANQLTALSNSQLNKVTVRFILLEKEAHLQFIVRNIQVPAHFIDYNRRGDEYIHRKTWGNSSLIWTFLIDKQTFINEDEFLKYRENNAKAIACIYDTPGMGKSELLKNLARKLTINHPYRIVIYTELWDLVKKSWENLTTENVTNFLIDFISPSNLAREMLLKVVDPNKIIDLFLDSYDDVPLKHIDQTVKLLNILESVPNIRVTMAARPHQIYESACSELTLYGLSPFTKEDQLEFLSKYWLSIFPSSNLQYLQETAKYSLQTFSLNLKNDDCHVIGLPLLCFLLGDICAENIYDFALLESKIQSLDTTHDIFRAFFENRLRYENVGKNKVIKEHTCLAFRELFSSDIALDFQQLFNVQVSNITICKYGIMEFRACDYQAEPKFIHRTFAEYLIADWYSSAFEGENIESLKCKSQFSSLINLLYECVFTTTHIGSLRDQLMTSGLYRADNLSDSKIFAFTYLTLNYFLNARLKHKSNFEQSTKNMQLIVNNVSVEQLYKIILSCLHHNYFSLLKINQFFFDTVLLSVDDIPFRNQMVTSFLMTVTNFSSQKSIDECRLFCNQKSNYVILKHNGHDPKQLTPLHLAIFTANYDLCEYFIVNCAFPLEKRAYLHTAVQGTYKLPNELITHKIQIIHMLLSKYSNILNEIWEDKHSLLVDNIHPSLIKLLVEKGASLYEKDLNDNTIIHTVAKYMSASCFHETVHFFIKERGAKDVFRMVNREGSTSLHMAMLVPQIECKTISLIISEVGSDLITQKDSKGKSVMMTVVNSEHTDLLKMLRDKCAIKTRNGVACAQ